MARFDEPLEWIDDYRKQAAFTVYDKSNSSSPGSVRLPNVGRESHTYLHHIVSRYDDLADWTVFSQASPPSFGYKGHRSGGGHLSEGVTFADYLTPREPPMCTRAAPHRCRELPVSSGPLAGYTPTHPGPL